MAVEERADDTAVEHVREGRVVRLRLPLRDELAVRPSWLPIRNPRALAGPHPKHEDSGA